MSVTVKYDSKLSVTEVIDIGGFGSSSPTVVMEVTPSGFTQNASTTQPATKAWQGEITLSGGDATIDLTALARSPLATVNATGLRLLEAKFVADSTNTNPVTVAAGASNGYAQFVDSLSLRPGEDRLMKFVGLTAIDSTHKTLDFSSAMLAAKIKVILTFGTVV